jgi:hypothetical protein
LKGFPVSGFEDFSGVLSKKNPVKPIRWFDGKEEIQTHLFIISVLFRGKFRLWRSWYFSDSFNNQGLELVVALTAARRRNFLEFQL